ncbi:unnamed protein product, partial [Phytomonas sp. EM1]
MGKGETTPSEELRRAFAADRLVEAVRALTGVEEEGVSLQRILAIRVLRAAYFMRGATLTGRRFFCRLFEPPDAVRGWLREAAVRCGGPRESLDFAHALQRVREGFLSCKDPTSGERRPVEGSPRTRVLSLKRPRSGEEAREASPSGRSRARADDEIPEKGEPAGGGASCCRTASDLLQTCVGFATKASDDASRVGVGVGFAARSLILPAQLAAAIEAVQSSPS